MLRYKALQIFKSFSVEDVKNFKLFLASPYFNTSKKVAQLFNNLSKFHPLYNSSKLTIIYLKKKMNTKSNSTINNLFADLFPLCERFLAQSKFIKNKHTYQQHLINELIARNGINDGIFKIAKKNIEKLEKMINLHQDFHRGSLHKLYQLEVSKFKLEMFNKPLKNIQVPEKNLNFLSNAVEYIFFYYFFNLLNAYVMTVSNCKFIGVPPEKTRLGSFFNIFFTEDKINQLLHGNNTLGDNISKSICELHWLYLQICLGKNILKDSIKYISILKKVVHKLHKDEKYNFYGIFNWWFPYILEHPEFEIYEFGFYDDFLKNEAYKISGHSYMIVTNFIHLYTRGDITGRHEWTNKLMSNYITAINPKYRESLIALRNSYLLFLKNEIDSALNELKKIKHHNETKIKTDIKYLGILIHYEQGEYEYVLNLIETFTKFLHKENTLLIEKETLIRFLKLVERLIKYEINKDKKSLKLLKEETENTSFIPSKPWLLKKISETI